jgi:hypothetical protein
LRKRSIVQSSAKRRIRERRVVKKASDFPVTITVPLYRGLGLY